MCTAATLQTKDFYFGRTLDYNISYGHEITITPRNYPFHFLEKGTVPTHYAMIGMAHIEDQCPLYYVFDGAWVSQCNYVESIYVGTCVPFVSRI